VKRSWKAARAKVDRQRTCEVCGAEFYDRQKTTIRQRYCSSACAGKAHRAKVAASYPPEDEVRRLYEDEGLSDRELGRRYGRSYQWSLSVRRHYGIAGRPRGDSAPSRKPLTKRSDRTRWAISRKPAECCRNCGDPAQVLHLHHAVPRSLSPAGKYDLRNGVQLCTRCHLGWHNGRVVLTRDIFTAEEWDFIQTLIGPTWLDKKYPARRISPTTRL
jgi:ribosomal protein L37AE/L43A